MRLVLLALVLAATTGCSVDDGTTTPTCTVASTDTCTGDTVCIGTTCQPAFPHAYAITQLSVTAPPLRPDGMPWNAGEDGSPNLFAEVSVAGAVVTTTSVNPMSYNATFAGPYTVMLDANVDLDIKASNNDGTATQVVADCDVPMVSALVLRTHYILCSGTGTTLNYTIEPL
ncbi:MAG: hypothetical protein ABI467_30570 [Kofleriaceae bacterium]